MVRVECKNAAGTFEPTPFYDSLPLIWSYKGADQGFPPVDLLREVDHYLDVLATHSFPSKEPPYNPEPDSERFEMQSQYTSKRYSRLFGSNGTYRFTIQVSAEDVDPQVIRLIFKWGGKWNKFEVYEDR